MLPSCDLRGCTNSSFLNSQNFDQDFQREKLRSWDSAVIATWTFTVKVPWQKKLIDGIIFQSWLMPAKKTCKITLNWPVKYTWVVDQSDNIINHHLSSRSISGESFNFYHVWNLRFLTPPPPPISLPGPWKFKKFLIHLIEKI